MQLLGCKHYERVVMTKFTDALMTASVTVQSIPNATKEDIILAQRLLIRHEAYDIMEILGIGEQ